MPDSVADASIIAAIAFGEPEADEASSLINGANLYAPSILAYELTNVARTKSARYPDQVEEIASALESALSLDLQWVDVDHIAVLRLALATDLSAYDASYLYVARTLGISLVTFDNRLSRASQNYLN